MLAEERASKGDQVDRPPSMRYARLRKQLPPSAGGNVQRRLSRLLPSAPDRTQGDTVNAPAIVATTHTVSATTVITSAVAVVARHAPAKRRESGVSDMLAEERASKGDQVDRPSSMRRSRDAAWTGFSADRMKARFKKQGEDAVRAKKPAEGGAEGDGRRVSGVRSPVSPGQLLGSAIKI